MESNETFNYDINRQDQGPIFVNQIIEGDRTPNDWQETLRGYEDKELLGEYDSALMWLSGTETKNGKIIPIGLEEGEATKLRDVLRVLTDEVHKRAIGDSTSSTSRVSEEDVSLYPRVADFDKLSEATVPWTQELNDYMYLTQKVHKSEEPEAIKNEQKEFVAKRDSRGRGNLTMGISSAALLLSISGAFLLGSYSNINTSTKVAAYSETEDVNTDATPAIHNDYHTKPTSSPTPEARPTVQIQNLSDPKEPAVAIMKSEGYLMETAVALPPTARETLNEGTEFNRRDILKIKASSFIIIIGTHDGSGVSCSTNSIERDGRKITFSLAKHCLINVLDEEFKLKEIPTSHIVNPETGENSELLLKREGIVFDEGTVGSDAAFLVGTIESANFVTSEVGFENIATGYTSNTSREIAASGYPAVLRNEDPTKTIFMFNAAPFSRYRDDLEIGVARDQTRKITLTQSLEIDTPVSHGASGGAAWSKAAEGTKMIGVISYGTDASIDKNGDVVSPVHTGISIIPEHLLARALKVYQETKDTPVTTK